MTNQDTIYTNKTALAMGIQLATEAGMPELADKFRKMYETANKPRKVSDAPTKEQMQTLAMVDEAVSKMVEGEPVTTAWVMANVNYVTSSQKATAVMKKAIALGKVVKGDMVKGKVTYILA